MKGELGYIYREPQIISQTRSLGTPLTNLNSILQDMEESARAKTAPRVKERRPPCGQDGAPKRPNKHPGLLKNEVPPPQPLEGNASIKKLFSEASKIVKLGMEKEYELLERNTTLQNSNETIDNLRKNMLHLQMEYEKLDQNFQREVSSRSEIVKRMDATRELVESVVQCSNVLAASVKQLEDDKLKITEFYELIYHNQKEVEMKHSETEKLLRQQDGLLKSKIQEINKSQNEILTQNSEIISQLNKKLITANDKLKTAANENENLKLKIQQADETSNRFQTFLAQEEKLNFLHQENILKLRKDIKILKIHRFKYQKLFKNTKKRLLSIVNGNKKLKKDLKKAELTCNQYALTNTALETKYNEWMNNHENQLEDHATERRTWESEKQKLLNQLTTEETEIENLKEENENLSSKISELLINEGVKKLELEQIQTDLSKLLNENLKLKDDFEKLVKENDEKANLISELEIKSNSIVPDLNSQLEFYKTETGKLKNVVKKLETELSEVQNGLTYEKAQNQKIISDLNNKLQKNIQERNEKMAKLEKLLEEKAAIIKNLQSEQTQTTVTSEAALEKLHNQLQSEKTKNEDLTRNFKTVKTTCEDVSSQLEQAKRQISDYEAKLTDLNSINKTLNRSQIDLEKTSADLTKEIEYQRKLFAALEDKHKKAEKELLKMQKISEENAALKSSTTELKNRLEATEARLEAYKVAVKKLESEKTETKNIHSEEVSKLKLELNRLEEAMKKEKLRTGTPQKSTESSQTKGEPETPITRSREKPADSLSGRLSTKENEPEIGEIEKWNQTSPHQTNKKFLSTPRKIFTSTPQTSFRNLTPIQKKRDPYDFDSDSSIEKFDQDKVLKVFNRQKKEPTNKRSKTKK